MTGTGDGRRSFGSTDDAARLPWWLYSPNLLHCCGGGAAGLLLTIPPLMRLLGAEDSDGPLWLTITLLVGAALWVCVAIASVVFLLRHPLLRTDR